MLAETRKQASPACCRWEWGQVRLSGEPPTTSSSNKIFNTCNPAVSLLGKQLERFSPEQRGAVCTLSAALPVGVGVGAGTVVGGRAGCTLHKMETCKHGRRATEMPDRRRASAHGSVLKLKLHTPPDVLEDTPCITRAHAHGDINKLHWCSCLWREGYRAGERGLDGKAGKATERCLPRTLTGQQCFMNSGP